MARLPDGERAATRQAVLEQRGLLRRSTGDIPGAAEDFTALVACAGDQVEVEVRGSLSLASVLFVGDRVGCLAVAQRAVERSQQVQDPLLRAHARGQLGHWRLQLRGWRDEDARSLAEALDAARRANDRTLFGLYLTLSAFNRIHRSEYRAACAAAAEGLPLMLQAGDAYHYMSGLCFRAWALLHLGEWGEAHRIVRDGLQMAEKNGHGVGTRVFQLLLGWLYGEAFDFARARELCEPVTRQAVEGQFDQVHSFIRLGMAHLGLGTCEAAFSCFREVTRRLEGGAIVDWIFHLYLHHGLSEYWLAQCQWAAARQEAEHTCAMAVQSGERTYLALGRRTLAEIALAERNWDQAEAELSQALAMLEGNEVPLAEWRVYATAARLHQRRRRKAQAERHRAHSRAVLHRLADSLGDETSLRQHMLSHLPV